MNSIELLKKRADKLGAVPDNEYHNHFKEDEAAINAIILDVWPTFEEDNPDVLSESGLSRLFADPRYQEIDRRVLAMRGTRSS